MKPASFARRARGAIVLMLAAVAAACGPGDPLGIGGSSVVVMGRVTGVASTGGPAAAPAAAPEAASLSALAGIEVGVEGSTVTTLTDDAGAFRLEIEVVADDGPLVLTFRRGPLDARIVLEGVSPGATVRIEVSLSDLVGKLLSRRDGRDDEFQGLPTLVSLTGDAGERTLRLSVADWGRIWIVDVLEATTAFEADGDVTTFEGFLAVLDRLDLVVEVEGDGTVRDDGTVLATSIKVETDDHDDDDHDNSGPGGG